MINRFSYFMLLLTILLACNKNNKPYNIVENQPKTIGNVRKEGLYEYDKTEFYYYYPFEKGGKNIFFSNVKPDDIILNRKNRPLSLNIHITRNPKVLEYFDKELNNEFVYYHYRNDSLISRLYLVENSLPNKNKRQRKSITSLDNAMNLLDSLRVNYTDKKESTKNNEKLIWIENKFPTYIFASKDLFYIEVYYKNFKTLGYNESLHFN